PQAGSGWQRRNHPDRLPANYHKLHGVRQFHGCYSVGDDTMFGVIHQQKSAVTPEPSHRVKYQYTICR
ncbi:hypothetical protein JNW90_27360, partial [Micromonospora sp. STR1s_5]|nr:hypothetical protein [Micromonospora sp. STR1s_5]